MVGVALQILLKGLQYGQREDLKTKVTCVQNRPWTGLGLKVFEMG